MKKTILVLLLCFCLFVCACQSKVTNSLTTDSESEQVKEVEEIQVKTPKDKLCDFIIENGEYNEEGSYIYAMELPISTEADNVKSNTDNVALICDESMEVTITWYSKQEVFYDLTLDPNDCEEQIVMTTLDFTENSSTMSVHFWKTNETPYVNSYLTGNSLKIAASGNIYPEQISSDDDVKINNIEFSYDSTLSGYSRSKVKSQVDSLFPSSVDVLLAALDLVLTSYSDISMNDLGFTNW